MHLTPREQERLLLASGADLARRRLARGAKLGAPEAIALVCDEICELAWDDVPYAEVVERARQVVAPDRLVDGVPAAVPSLQVEALFPHGSVLVHVDAPFGPPPADGPGAVRPAAGEVTLAPGRERATAVLRNTGPLPIWVSSHVPLDRLNSALDVRAPEGARYRLDVPAGTALRIDAGAEREVAVVRIGGPA
ncbi:urease subunit gamma [Pseudonocardia nigra]|uniref:urease subunit gamma n=1 Tax=Pseudonocardia nigra TaxID=1921578 RepID=UPI001C605FA3|nr:urease subunit gamma [Pseudonocardia nigra]